MTANFRSKANSEAAAVNLCVLLSHKFFVWRAFAASKSNTTFPTLGMASKTSVLIATVHYLEGLKSELPQHRNPNPADGELLQLVKRNPPKSSNSFILQAKSFCVPVPHPTNNLTSLLQKRSTQHPQAKCCWKSLFLLCVWTEPGCNAILYAQATQASHLTPQPGSLAKGSPITHIVAPGASDGALKKKNKQMQRPSLGGSAKLTPISETEILIELVLSND